MRPFTAKSTEKSYGSMGPCGHTICACLVSSLHCRIQKFINFLIHIDFYKNNLSRVSLTLAPFCKIPRIRKITIYEQQNVFLGYAIGAEFSHVWIDERTSYNLTTSCQLQGGAHSLILIASFISMCVRISTPNYASTRTIHAFARKRERVLYRSQHTQCKMQCALASLQVHPLYHQQLP